MKIKLGSRRLCPESLESRIAPAAVLAYTDVDGDKVTVKSTVGDLTGKATIVDGQLRVLDVNDPSFSGASITVSVVKAGGDGLAAVGRINAGSNNLGAVSIQGDLGDIDAGSNNPAIPAIKGLSVRSMGVLGLSSQGGVGDLQSDIHGALGSLKVVGDVKEAYIHVFGGSNATLGPVTIGGSLVGGFNTHGGEIESEGNLGSVKIGHDVRGGFAQFSAFVFSHLSLKGITIGGSLIGGSFGDSGKIESDADMGMVRIGQNVQGGSGDGSGAVNSLRKLAGIVVGGSLIGGGDNSGIIESVLDMGTVSIGHDVRGGSGTNSGAVRSSNRLSSVTIGGSVVGGTENDTGNIFSLGDMGSVRIGHDIRGGAGQSSGDLGSGRSLFSVTIGGSVIGGSGQDSGSVGADGDIGTVKIGGDLKGASIVSGSLSGSGYIESNHGRIVSVTIGGSLIVGADNSSTGSLDRDASIRAFEDIGTLTVKGGMQGSVGVFGDVTPVVVSARGQAMPTETRDLAIGKLKIAGPVAHAKVLAGYDIDLSLFNKHAQIGAVKIGPDWTDSVILIGV